MPTTADGSSGLNAKLYFLNDDSPATYDEVPFVYDIGPTRPGTPDRVELTHHGVTDFTRRYARSFSDPGTIPIRCNYHPENAFHQQIIADSLASTSRTWKLEHPTDEDDFITFSATASAAGTEQPMEDRLTLAFDLVVEGAYNFNFAAP
jgi:hypothetical protein